MPSGQSDGFPGQARSSHRSGATEKKGETFTVPEKGGRMVASWDLTKILSVISRWDLPAVYVKITISIVINRQTKKSGIFMGNTL